MQNENEVGNIELKLTSKKIKTRSELNCRTEKY